MRRARAVLGRILTNLAMVVLFAVAGVMLVPAALGYHRYIILTGSMTGTYDPGSLVFDKPVPTEDLKVGDVITYAPPPGTSPNHKLVTHRIFRILPGPGGRRAYVTKGDFNRKPDNWKFLLPQPTQDKVRFGLPYVGFVFELLSVRQFRLLAIGLPAFGMALWSLFGLWREGGEEVQRRRAGLKPWGKDVARGLPQLTPRDEAAVHAATATVRVPVGWPAPAPSGTARRAAVGFDSPFVRPRRRAGTPGVVALPDGCVAAPRGRRSGRRQPLSPGWRLRIDPRAAPADTPAV